MSHGVITLIITGCDQDPGNCWIAAPVLGDSYQQFNVITDIPTFFLLIHSSSVWSRCICSQVRRLRSCFVASISVSLEFFHHCMIHSIQYSIFNSWYSSTRMESIKVCLKFVTIVVLLLDWWFILLFDEITLDNE